MELKQLPQHLKYAYLGEETLPVIITRNLTDEQEEQLIEVLKKHKLAIGWTITDIRGINHVICMHKVTLKDGSKPCPQPQKCLNPTLKEVVIKEIFNLPKVGIIYPIADSEWVSLIHIVPKKIGITIIKKK